MPRPAEGESAPAPQLLGLQQTIGNAAVARLVDTRLLQRVAMKPALKKALRASKGWSEEDVDDEGLREFCESCATEAQAKMIANAVTYEDWSTYLAGKTIPTKSEDLVELVEQEKVRKKNVELQAASSRPQAKEPEFDRARYLDQGIPSSELAARLQEANLVFTALGGPDQRALMDADADYVGARGAGKASAKAALAEKVQEVRRDRERSAQAQVRSEERRRTADDATARMHATPGGDPLANDLVSRIWTKAVDSYVNQNANVTLDGEWEPAAIRTARDTWARVRNRCNRLGISNLHVPGGEQFIEDKGPKDIQRGSSRREARWYQADFISHWPGINVNVHVDATGPLPTG